VLVDARIRYRSEPVPASARIQDGRAELRFEKAQRAVTPGQAVVFYSGERVVGGGTIVRRL
jgi:tRNA-specific 2-thiouridylase